MSLQDILDRIKEISNNEFALITIKRQPSKQKIHSKKNPFYKSINNSSVKIISKQNI